MSQLSERGLRTRRDGRPLGAARKSYAFACAALLALAAVGAASEAYDGTWEAAWNDSSRPGERAASAEGGLATAFDSRVAGVGTTAPGAVDGRFRDSEESEAGRLDTRPPAGFFIIVR